MCGITGVFGSGDISLNNTTLLKMLSKIAHRGPDGQGMVIFTEAGLAHVRLAIIDVVGGQQPMSTEDGNLHITYNGELYNFQEIKSRLQEDGISFQTDSDTEVILKAWRHYGVDIIPHFRGMFAFAIWDETQKKGYLVRDRFGIKPLYWTKLDNQVVFGSEIKALLPVMPHFPGLNRDSLNSLMNFRYIPGEETLFNNIVQIPPGYLVEWSRNKVELKRWSPQLQSDGLLDILHIRELLLQSVKRQLVSDVQVGSYLSGGIDSATIVSIASKSEKKFELPTFTIQVGDSKDEAANALKTANHFNLSNYQQHMGGALSDIISRLIYHLEVPKVNAWQSALVAQLASQHVKVSLSGLGGDEVFLGYNIHSIMAGFARLNGPFGNTAKLFGAFSQLFFSNMGLQFEEFKRAGQTLRGWPDYSKMYGIVRNVWDSKTNRNRIYGPRMISPNIGNSFTKLQGLWPDIQDPVIAAARYEMQHKMVNDLLLQEDRLSMAFGLEVRVPFLDEDLVDFVWGINRKEKMKRGKKKSLLCSAVSQWVPEEILNRPKSGFQVPVHLFFDTHLRPLCAKHLSRKRLLQDGLFNPLFVEDVLRTKVNYRMRWHYFLLYLMIGVNIWLDIFQNGAEVPEWS